MTERRNYAIFALDPTGHITSWNADSARMKGYEAAEIIGRHFSVFYPEDKVAAGYPDSELRWAAKSGFYIDDGLRVRKDGTEFWAHVVITAQRDAEGDLIGFVKVTRDDSMVSGWPSKARRSK
jgi:PAS domain S-box-containing protein